MFRTGCEAPLRHRHAIPDAAGGEAVMLLKPAWRTGGPMVVKIVNVFPENAAHGLPAVLGLVVLFDGATGDALAVIDGRALTVRRTAAASALAAGYLARRDATTLLMVGTGQLAPALVEAHAATRPIRSVLIWGRSPGKAARLAETLSAKGFAARPVTALDSAVAEADIVSSATLSPDPLIMGAWLRPGTHVDLVGSFMPDMREADDEVMRRGRIFVDTRDGALGETGDLIKPIAAGVIAERDIAGELAELCRGDVDGRGDDREITVFKSVGTALEDLAAAELAFERRRG